jgi:hypothetical protein
VSGGDGRDDACEGPAKRGAKGGEFEDWHWMTFAGVGFNIAKIWTVASDVL